MYQRRRCTTPRALKLVKVPDGYVVADNGMSYEYAATIDQGLALIRHYERDSALRLDETSYAFWWRH